MPPQQVSRSADTDAVAQFLASSCAQPSALVVEGEAGIGKTTLWLSAVEQARQRGMRVLSARAAAAESVMAYTSLADLLAGAEPDLLAELPAPQRLAVDRILLRASDDGEATDQRAVAAAFLSVVGSLAGRSPVLVAIDDLQWLDPSSAHVIAFAARRVSGPVGVLCTVRTGAPSDDTASWLQLHRPDAIRRIQLQPLSIGGLHAVVRARMGRSLSRRAMATIHDASGGNPFYGIELAKALAAAPPGRTVSLPNTLAGLVRAKLGELDHRVRDALLAVACLAAPTVEVVSQAIALDGDDLVDSLADAEAEGIITIDGHRLRFSHPLLASGIYTDATPAQRRTMHRRLASLVDQPELRARHLALAATRHDPATVEALDGAAQIARLRGAPAAAAELIDLAIQLGGDTAQRQIQSATCHFNAGDAAHARTVLEQTLQRPAPPELRAEALHLLGLWSLLDGSSREAAELLERALGDAGDDLALRTQILVPLSFAHVNARRLDDAAREAEDAVASATRLGQPQLLSQALSMRVLVRFLLGLGVDERDARRALELENPQAAVSALLYPTLQNAELLLGTGRLEQAGRELAAIARRYVERGEESELMIVAFHSGLNEIWRGNFTEANHIAEDAMERAVHLDRDLPLSVALMLRAALAAYGGDEDKARRDANEALAICQRCDSPHLVIVWPITMLGFLEVSLGNYDAALGTLQPLLGTFGEAPRSTEIFVAPFLPDAAEALIQSARTRDAEPLITALEANGARLDRPWMSALGARCRAMLLGANGDLDTAYVAARQAMAAHDRLPMPFERARTQLLLGQLQRRHHQRDAAEATLREALAVFEHLNTPLWAARAQASLARTTTGPATTSVLTAAERRVAELAASGLTNSDVGAALYISPKTVEVHLSRIYRKLGIRSRAELGRRIDQLDS
jgi:DNA-binding CsgD family transcriptional regulator